MRKRTIKGRVFVYTIASDVIRDGIGVELSEERNGNEIYIAEVFRNDQKKTIEFSADVRDLPFETLQELLDVFNREIPKEYQD
jgi:hypothetical protein